MIRGRMPGCVGAAGRVGIGVSVATRGTGVGVTNAGGWVAIGSAGVDWTGGGWAGGGGGAVAVGCGGGVLVAALVDALAPFGVWPARKTSFTTFGQSRPGASPVAAHTSANSMPAGTSKFTT